MPEAKNFFKEEQVLALGAAITAAELSTSGEIRVHMEDLCTGSPVERATKVFQKLRMHRTRLRNGVLFYLAVKDKKFAIVGDQGIHEKVGADFWDEVKGKMLERFMKEEFTEGLCEGIGMAGNKLQHHFPFTKGDKNELENVISFSK